MRSSVRRYNSLILEKLKRCLAPAFSWLLTEPVLRTAICSAFQSCLKYSETREVGVKRRLKMLLKWKNPQFYKHLFRLSNHRFYTSAIQLHLKFYYLNVKQLNHSSLCHSSNSCRHLYD